MKFFSAKIVFFTNLRNFYPLKVFHYAVPLPALLGGSTTLHEQLSHVRPWILVLEMFISLWKKLNVVLGGEKSHYITLTSYCFQWHHGINRRWTRPQLGEQDKDVCRFIRSIRKKCPFLVHSTNPDINYEISMRNRTRNRLISSFLPGMLPGFLPLWWIVTESRERAWDWGAIVTARCRVQGHAYVGVAYAGWCGTCEQSTKFLSAKIVYGTCGSFVLYTMDKTVCIIVWSC